MKHSIGLALALVLAGCAEEKTQPLSMRALGQKVQVEETRSDEVIGVDVRKRLDLANAAETSGVVVEVDAGVVTLRGVAPSVAAAWRAQAAATSVPGVQQVINRILVGGHTP